MDQQQPGLSPEQQRIQQQYNYQQPPYQPGYYYPQPPAKKSRVWLWVLLGSVAFVALLIWAIVSAGNSIGEQIALDDPTYMQEPYVAMLRVEGTITGASNDLYNYTGMAMYDHEFVLSSIDELIYDDANRGLLLFIDSPGGEVLATTEVAEKVLEYKEVTGRPVFAYGHNYAASGGYWIACAADRFYANRYCVTGSIGVTYGTMLDISGLLERYGVTTTTITSGDQKAMGSSYEPMSPETEAIFQTIIDEYFGYFLDWVGQCRGMSRETLLPLADGRIYTAKQAMEAGLADQVGTYQVCLDDLLNQAGEDCWVKELEPPVAANFFSLFSMESEAALDAATLLQLAPPSGVLAYYRQ